MGSAFNADWVETVREKCDLVFEGAHVGFTAQVEMNATGPALLWEADPEKFAKRYPDSGIVESYGSSWPPPCIDYWIYVDAEQRRARLVPEGWNTWEIDLELSGDRRRDARTIAREFARILRVADPSGEDRE